MAKCNSCGKKGLFLKVNSSGRCDACDRNFQLAQEQQRLEEEQERRDLKDVEFAEKYFQEIVKQHERICSKIVFTDESIELSDVLSALDDKREMCNNLKTLLSSCNNYPKLYDVLCQHTESYSDNEYGTVQGRFVY